MFLGKPQNILVRMPNWLGDLVMGTPVLADLRLQFPEATITAMVSQGLAPVLQHDPHIDAIYGFKKASGWLHHNHNKQIISTLRKGDFDIGILLTNSFSSAYWMWQGKVARRIGFSGHFRGWLLNDPVLYPADYQTIHHVLLYKHLLTPLNIPLSQTSPRLYVTEEEQKAVQNKLDSFHIPKNSLIVGVNPGAAYGAAKCWIPERFIEVTKKLLEDPRVYVLYFGDPAGTSLVETICKGLSDRVINLAGKTTLRELIAFIEACTVFLTNDSGPMHVASALGTPLVALFGSTSDIRTGPYGGGEVIHKRAPCSPCYQRVCPIDFRCMKEISVDEVYARLRKLLG